MQLESLVEKYEKDTKFRWKSKIKNLVKKSKPYRLMLTVPLFLGLAFTYDSYLRNGLSSYHKELNEVSKQTKEILKKTVDLEDKLTASFQEENIEFLKSREHFYHKEFDDFEKFTNLMGSKETVYFLYGIFGFYLVSDLLKKKKVSGNKTNLFLLGSYAVTRLSFTDNLMDLNSEEIIRLGISSLNDISTLIISNTFLNYLYHVCKKKPSIINLPQFFIKAISGKIKKDEDLIKDSYKSLSEEEQVCDKISLELFQTNYDEKNIPHIRDSLEGTIDCREETMKGLNELSFLERLNFNHEDPIVKYSRMFSFFFKNANYVKAFEKLKDTAQSENYGPEFLIINSLMLNKFVELIKHK
ncbi:hypothetical protein KY321_05720, partial [Candidatus Woesearchaeota archaeon]|nr:hypothetical protein [Candidatus Woesearchaeota archaeon]